MMPFNKQKVNLIINSAQMVMINLMNAYEL